MTHALSQEGGALPEMAVYRGGVLTIDDISLEEIAAAHGTPCYVYGRAALEARARAFEEAFGGLPARLCYAAKANGTLAVLDVLGRRGWGLDIVSAGELRRGLAAGIPAERMVFSGVGKTAGEIRLALEEGVFLLNVESAAELELTARVAAEVGRAAPVGMRVNPDIEAGGHPYIVTGNADSKFGIPWSEARGLYGQAAESGHLEVRGIGCHLGSQITDLSCYHRALVRLGEHVAELAGEGVRVSHVDLGGGLGISYNDEKAPEPRDWAQTVEAALPEGVELIVEPGRAVVGPAGLLLARVVREKQQGGSRYVVVDAAMNDLLRPALYGAYHRVLPVCRGGAPTAEAKVVGPVCESGDFLSRGAELPPLEPGDLVAVLDAGAYSFVMASNYNGRPRPAEVMVWRGSAAVVRTRETWEDMLNGERVWPGA